VDCCKVPVIACIPGCVANCMLLLYGITFADVVNGFHSLKYVGCWWQMLLPLSTKVATSLLVAAHISQGTVAIAWGGLQREHLW